MKRALLFLLLIPAFAQGATVYDACTSFTVSGNVLTCVPNGTPQCPSPPGPGPCGGPVPQCPSPPGAGPCGGPITCQGFTNTRVMVANWQNPQRMYTSSYGGFGPTDALVIQFTAGSGSSTNNLPRLAGAEYNAAPAQRQATLSPTPCDFGHQPMPGANAAGTTITIPFAVGTGNNYGYYATVPSNATWYLNVKNVPSGGCTSDCNMFFDLNTYGVQ